ncbi:phage tail protein [Beijerinckia sp. L45]|uniref:phage tail protein n=1 Tax=Beijerinckia sp. L45 TaxID=1641855 RepID=UPI001FEFA5C6|nr:phage tail protein [Beijerinckia sp. L45]
MPPMLEVKLDPAQLEKLGNLIGAAGKNAPAALARAINHTGDKAKTAMTQALTVQTGLKRKVIVKALKVSKASASTMTYTIRSAGGDIGLKYFGARETRSGVSAAPWGRRQIYAGTFMKGGRFPNRVAISKLNGQVMKRTGSGRAPIAKQRSGLFIPVEMVSGATAAAFDTVATRDLPDRLVHELMRIIGP